MGGDQRSQTIESHGELILSLYEATPDITLQAWAEVETATREKRKGEVASKTAQFWWAPNGLRRFEQLIEYPRWSRCAV